MRQGRCNTTKTIPKKLARCASMFNAWHRSGSGTSTTAGDIAFKLFAHSAGMTRRVGPWDGPTKYMQCKHAYMHLYVYACVCMYIYVLMHIHMYTIYIYICM